MLKHVLKPKITTKQMTKVGVLSAITIVMGLSGIGFVPLPALKATIMHLPVIIGAILEGPIVGMLIGLIFGVFSIIQNITTPTVLSFALINPLVSILPRMLIGITAYYTYNLVIKAKKNILAISVAAAVGSITNTVGVLGMIYLLYVDKFAEVRHVSVDTAIKVVYGIALTNGIAEAIIASIIVTAVVISIRNIDKR
jgi:uncharacterized membrane protein